ncbi:MAG: dihydrolipoyl dehydrogenase [Deltaproteobacteria bacterium]|nr:dihydrolipoyl dehydrogenase [Deltaproteobacteria bacterium]
MTQNYDLIVIGTGPGGYVAAIRASQLGLKVAVVEREKVGGVCLNWGCIPTKSLLESAHLFAKMQRAEDYGLKASSVGFDFTQVIKRSRQVAGRLEKGVQFLFKKNKIDLYEGEAVILAPGEVGITSCNSAKELQAKNILLATGARPRSLPGIEPDGEKIITYREAIQLSQCPKNLAIIGAGAIGVEMAYFYASLGAAISLFEVASNILPFEDQEVSEALEKQFKKEGWGIHTSARVEKVEKNSHGVKIVYRSGDQQGETSADLLLLAVGMQGNGDRLGKVIQGDPKTGFVKVNERFQTAKDGIYAIGDLIGPPLLAHVASAEGLAAVEGIAGKKGDSPKPRPINYDRIPSCVYCEPQVAHVGLTEKQARERTDKIRVGRFPFQASGRALSSGETFGFVKVIVDDKYGEILGVHLVGAGVTELVAEVTTAMNLEATGESLYQSIHSHPTLSEAVMEAAANAYGCAIHI